MTDDRYKKMIRLSTSYEWDIEEIDEFGDVEEHNFRSKLKDLLEIKGDLVLVRTTGSEANGVDDRQWAYVENGELPETFSDGAKIPEKFRKELKNFLAVRRGLI